MSTGLSRRETSPMFGPNRFRLGVFGLNCAGGLAATKVPERWRADWDEGVAVGRMAEESGIDFLLPIARWRGWGGEADLHGDSQETLSWACGMLAATRRITVFGTVHVPLVHPIFAAKQMTTADHIGKGRFGLNIVCGWNQDEFEMFGVPQREHDDRYAYGQEWWDVVHRIWESEERFDFDGDYLKLAGVIGRPGPHGGTQPVLMNAGASEAGRAFGARNCDFLFTQISDIAKGGAGVAAIKRQARDFGRDVDVIATSYLVCRPTTKEAEDYHHYYVYEHGDWEAADNLRLQAWNHQLGRPPEFQKELMYRYCAGHGSYPLIGTPDDIAVAMQRMAEVGFAGSTIAFVDYGSELPYFRDEVLPRLERLGLRQPPGK
jgi:alkanesulfonate monooxygenase SsuD/methylene tetrahydromethanopterin reductase-like flavin-dependent oxidoreductase (luciferase family)